MSGLDEKSVDAIMDTAIANGINYFDTAWGYHGGKSEIAMGISQALNNTSDTYKWFID